VSDPACPACAGAWPDPGHRIAGLSLTVAYLHEDQFLPGWTILVLRRHATELWELTPDERAELLEEVTLVARALDEAYGAAKLNYALLGNQIPHVHWHLVPRRRDDPAPREAPWSIAHAPRRLGPAELEASLAELRLRLPH